MDYSTPKALALGAVLIITAGLASFAAHFGWLVAFDAVDAWRSAPAAPPDATAWPGGIVTPAASGEVIDYNPFATPAAHVRIKPR